MVSFYLLHRGLWYFTYSSTNILPLLKHAMDTHFTLRYASITCEKPWFKYTCFDDFGTDWTMTTELGCVSVIALLTFIMIGFHTGLALYHFAWSCRGQNDGFLAGTELGCCGAAAVIISFAAYDAEVDEAAGKEAKWRRATRFATAVLQVPLLVATCVAINIVSAENAWDSQRSSLFLLLVVLMLNLASLVENVYEGMLMVKT
ncbi:hypothetical protein DFS34DRAFT_693121 [Phlyctochytrium arcticum]|nr:hypothetical protein DFS34DRAFT_693121 [Phlyctochytrium arcticum]